MSFFTEFQEVLTVNIHLLQQTLFSGEAYLVSSPENRRYLTEFSSTDGFLIVTKNEAVFLTDSRYIEAAQNQVKGCSEISQLNSLSAQLPEYLKKLGIEKLFTESVKMTVEEFNRISKIAPCSVSAEKTDVEINILRRKKSEEEKNCIIRAQRIAEKAFEHILGFISIGKTEKEIALELDFFMLRNGAEAVSFETIAVSGANSSMPHGVPSDKKIENGDFITMDFGAVINGYHSDMTRTVAVGSVSTKQAKIYETVLNAQLASLAVLKDGISGFDADKAARDIISDAGYGDYFGHGTGHGVGIEIHEEPRLSPKTDKILCEGDIVTVEPGIYLPGEFGVRIEDMAFITKNGAENLTKSPKNLIII